MHGVSATGKNGTFTKKGLQLRWGIKEITLFPSAVETKPALNNFLTALKRCVISPSASKYTYGRSRVDTVTAVPPVRAMRAPNGGIGEGYHVKPSSEKICPETVVLKHARLPPRLPSLVL